MRCFGRNPFTPTHQRIRLRESCAIRVSGLWKCKRRRRVAIWWYSGTTQHNSMYVLGHPGRMRPLICCFSKLVHGHVMSVKVIHLHATLVPIILPTPIRQSYTGTPFLCQSRVKSDCEAFQDRYHCFSAADATELPQLLLYQRRLTALNTSQHTSLKTIIYNRRLRYATSS